MEQLPSDVFSQICMYLPKDSLYSLELALEDVTTNLQSVYQDQNFWKMKLEKLLGIRHLPNSIQTDWKTRYEVFASLPSPDMMYLVQAHYEPIDMTIAALAGITLNDRYRDDYSKNYPDQMKLFTLRYAVLDNNIKVVERLLLKGIFDPVHVYDAYVTAKYLGYTDIADLLMHDSRYRDAKKDPRNKAWNWYYTAKGML